MPDRPDEQIVSDALLLQHWLQSEYFPPFKRFLEDLLEDAEAAVLNRNVASDADLYAVLERKGRWGALSDILSLVHYQIAKGEKVRRQ